MKGGYVEPEYVQAMLDREKLTSTYLGESIAVPHGTIEAKDRVLKTGVVFCQYPEGVRFGEDEDDVARLVIGIAARNNEHIQVITSLTNALDDETVIERLAKTTSVDEVLALLNKYQNVHSLSLWERVWVRGKASPQPSQVKTLIEG